MIKQTIPEMTGGTPELRSAGIEALKAFHINYQFIRFIRKNWLGPFPKKAEAIFQRLDDVRNRLISLNFPLAINRAKIFYRKTPKGHLSLMDMIGICGVGLIAGIDKYVGEYTKVFNGVAIGRMTGYLIDSYSETLLHFFPSDKRILYKAHSIRGRQGVEEVDELAKAVNQSFSDDKKEGKSVPKEKIDTGSLNGLMTAASVVSADATSDGGEEGYGVYTYTASSSPDAETRYSEREIWQKTVAAMSELSCLQRKVLRLKGVKI
jgi:DNA-directed RNA polymerase specialized sigma subunit